MSSASGLHQDLQMDIWHERLLHSHMTHSGLLLREQLNQALGLFPLDGV